MGAMYVLVMLMGVGFGDFLIEYWPGFSLGGVYSSWGWWWIVSICGILLLSGGAEGESSVSSSWPRRAMSNRVSRATFPEVLCGFPFLG